MAEIQIENLANSISELITANEHCFMNRNVQFYSEKLFRLAKKAAITESHQYVFQIAKAYFHSGQFLRCTSCILEHKMQFYNTEFLILITLSMLQSKDFEKVVEILSTNYKFVEPSSLTSFSESILNLNLARAYWHLENLSKARKFAVDALKFDYTNYEAFDFLFSLKLIDPLKLNEIISALGNREEDWLLEFYSKKLNFSAPAAVILVTDSVCEPLFDKMVEVRDNDYLHLLAEHYLTVDDFEKAYHAIKQVTDYDAFNMDMVKLELELYSKDKRSSELGVIFNKLNLDLPDSYESHYAEGLYLMSLKKHESARSKFDSAILKNSKERKALLSKARCHSLAFESEFAIIAYKQYCRTFPSCAIGVLELGKEYITIKPFELAQTFLMRALEIEPTNSYIHDSLGVLFFRMDK